MSKKACFGDICRYAKNKFKNKCAPAKNICEVS